METVLIISLTLLGFAVGYGLGWNAATTAWITAMKKDAMARYDENYRNV